jgi:hypothetical protein
MGEAANTRVEVAGDDFGSCPSQIPQAPEERMAHLALG